MPPLALPIELGGLVSNSTLVAESNQVEYTISQDRAAGHHAHEESGYKLLSGRGFDLASTGGHNSSSQVPFVNMLERERQNLARQQLQIIQGQQPAMIHRKGRGLSFGSLDTTSFASTEKNATKKRAIKTRQRTKNLKASGLSKNSLRSKTQRKRERVEFEVDEISDNGEDEDEDGDDDEDDDDDADGDETDGNKEFKAKHVGFSPKSKRIKSSPPASGSQLRESQRYATIVQQQTIGYPKSTLSSPSLPTLKKFDGYGTHSGTSSHTSFTDYESDNQHYVILYRVFCSDSHRRCHGRIYRDAPRTVVIKGICHLSGDFLVSNLDDLLQNREQIAFIVYRDSYCKKGTTLALGYGPRHLGTHYYRELVSILSEDLHSTIRRKSKFAPDEEAYKIYPYDKTKWKSSALSAAPIDYSTIFLYHHRHELCTEADDAPEGSAIKALASYIFRGTDRMVAKCDKMFSQGLVSCDTLPWLFHPNDVVVSTKDPMPTAYVLRRFPTEDSHFTLLAWNWGYDGHWLRRKDTKLTVNFPTYGEMPINTLSVYPLRYASSDTKEKLLNNGQNFWNLRQQRMVSYQGLDFGGEHTYVSCHTEYIETP
ncbi:hypothetical protein TWF694_006330 [Orbilia ellipsospora]|uniref:DUF7025 domain-containing protein n=1 Tax=Orbilia ellipsospora TaxID=2528407 RepID=A0AAV9XJW5_9PEZI